MEDEPVNTKRVTHPLIGEISIRPNKKSKRINLYIDRSGELLVTYPARLPQKHVLESLNSKVGWIESSRTKIRERDEQCYIFDNIDRDMAKLVLSYRLAMYADKYGFTYKRVFIRNQRTRWGSQSAQGNINLNCKLVRLPVEMMDYVILHELVHSRIRNHSKDFWDELAKYCPDHQRIRERFKRYRMTP